MQIVVARSFDEIEAIRPTWEYMQRNQPNPAPDADIDRYLSVLKSNGDGVKPYVMLIKHDDEPAVMIIGRIGSQELSLKLGYKTLLNPMLRCLTVVYGGILGQPEGDLCPLLVTELMKQLRSQKIDVIYFNHLRTDTPFYKAVQNTPCLLTRGNLPKIDKHWCMPVPEKMDQFYLARSHKHRQNLRRAIRKFEAEYPGKSRFITYKSESDVDDFIRIASGISSKTYQNALGVGIVDNKQTRILMTTAARHGWFRGHILFAGDKPCAFQLGLSYKEVYFLVSIGYDPAFASYCPGKILFLKVLESLCDDLSIDKIDFYFGDAWYKKSYATECWEEASTYIFSPTLYSIFINVLRSSLSGVNATLKYFVNKIGLINRIKRQWRTLLRRTDQIPLTSQPAQNSGKSGKAPIAKIKKSRPHKITTVERPTHDVIEPERQHVST